MKFMKLLLVVIPLFLPITAFGSNEKIILHCQGTKNFFIDMKYQRSEKVDYYYIVRYDKYPLGGGPKQEWFIEKDDGYGNKNYLSSNINPTPNYRTEVIVTDSSIFYMLYIQKDNSLLDYKEEINRNTGVWTSLLNSDKNLSGNRRFNQEKITGKCFKEDKKF